MKTYSEFKKAKEPEAEYPELGMLADVIVREIIIEINNTIDDNIDLVKTKCPYPYQCTLEMVISKLEECV